MSELLVKSAIVSKSEEKARKREIRAIKAKMKGGASQGEAKR